MAIFRKKKNIDRVRKMSVDELSKLFESPEVFCRHHQGDKAECDKLICRECIKEYLESEVE